MSEEEFLKGWYSSPDGGEHVSMQTILDSAFQEAKKIFTSELTLDNRKIDLIDASASMTDVSKMVSGLLEKYCSQREDSNMKKWLAQFSSRIKFYGDILDVLVQHHPEYVALVWGAIKLLFTSVMNHEKVVKTLAKAIYDITDKFPRIELSAFLYPTQQMTAAVARLYAYLLRFLIRAHDWCKEGTLKHIWHSVTRPVELRYDDLLKDIERESQAVHQLAETGQHAEIRVMNDKIDTEFKGVRTELKALTNVVAALSAASLDTNDLLSDMQFSQIMESISDHKIWDPQMVFEYYYSLRHRRSYALIGSMTQPFWLSPKLQRWSTSHNSALSMVLGNYRSRFALRGFCINIIEQLQSSQVPILLALRATTDSTTATEITSIDLLKYLIRQGLQLNQEVQTEKSMALSCRRFHTAVSETQWFGLFESVLSEIGRLVYLVIDLEILDRKYTSDVKFSWLEAFRGLFNTLAERQSSTVLKVLFINYGSQLPFSLSVEERAQFVVPAGMNVQPVSQRKRTRPMITKFNRFKLARIGGPTDDLPSD